ncbi:MAG: heparinase II/III family protein [Clostridia bacterium]|nr:heparinase II/III family protein [Clostridia bacterium]
MFQKWLENHDPSAYTYGRLFPPVSDRAFWDRYMTPDCITAAEHYLGYEWPMIRATQFMEFQKSGNRLVQETPLFDRRMALVHLFLGELTENKGRFLPDLTDGIFAVCEETYWGLSAHAALSRKKELLPSAEDPYIDLFAAETAEILALIYHILYQPLKEYCPPILERLEYETERRIIGQYLRHDGYFWMGRAGKKVNNWNPWILANILTVFLVMEPRSTRLTAGLRKMLTEINHYYNAIPADGGCDEGSGYWTKAGAKLFEFCDILYVATDGAINFFEDEKLKNIGLYEERAYIDGCYFVNFADGTARLDRANLDYPLYGLGKRADLPSMCRLAGKLHTLQDHSIHPDYPRGQALMPILYSFIYAKEIQSQPPFTPADRHILPDIQVSFIRAKDWYYAAKGGHNKESHNHNDVGNFLLFHCGEFVLIDPGCGVYTRQTFSPERYTIWTMQSGWHNLPVLNGTEQRDGAEFAADSFAVEGKTTTVSFAGAYPEAAGIQTALRRISMDEQGLTLQDTFTFTAEQNTVEEHFITLLKPQKTENGILLGGRYLLTTDLPATFEKKEFHGDSKLLACWKQDHLWRICLKAKCGKNAEFFFTVKEVTP